MLETRLLRRVIHYIWECYRQAGEIKILLRNYKGDELHVEERTAELKVVVRYFTKQPSGELAKQMEVECFILRHGEWIPLMLGKGGRLEIYATANAETGQVDIMDSERQLGAALFCDAWAMHFLEKGFLATAAQGKPLLVKRSSADWPQPIVPLPSLEQLEDWRWEDGGCESSDGCWVSYDGTCPHGHPSWLLRLGLA